MLRRCAPLLAMLAVTAVTGVEILAQSANLRSRVEQELFTFGECGEPLCLDLDNLHGDHFLPGLNSGNAAVINFVTDAIGQATSSVPLSATSGGATFTFVGGLPVRTSTSAGPIFGERSQTLGRGRFFLGASVTGMEFTSLNGAPMQGLELNFGHDIGDDEVRGNPEFENEVMSMLLDMKVAVVVGTVAMTAGLTDFIDIGVAVPFVRTSVEGRSTAQFAPFGNPATHYFAGDVSDPVLRASASMSGTASGIGDVAARLKINLGQGESMGAALLAEARLPTGDEENLLGSGATQIRAMGVYSAQFGTFSPHVNFGYQASGSESINDKLLIVTSVDNLLSDWATLAVGVEAAIDVGEPKFALPEPIVIDVPFERTIPATNIPSEGADLIRATMGAKFTVREGTVLFANGIFPLTKNGLQPDYIWTLGLDFPF